MSLWFHPPIFGIVAELKDPRSFSETLDRLMESANRELKSAGAMVKPQPGQPVRPGTEFAEFRKLKAPEHGYILAVPPPSLRHRPDCVRPCSFDDERGVLVVAATPALARAARSALVFDAPVDDAPWPHDAFVYSTSDPSNSLPELLVNLPSLIQFIGHYATSEQPRPGALPGIPATQQLKFRLAIDPDIIPEADQLRPYLFPSKFSMAADDASIRLSAYQAFPLPAPSLDVGIRAPVLISRLLPAVPVAREAARRS